jgi:hypothetical protein
LTKESCAKLWTATILGLFFRSFILEDMICIVSIFSKLSPKLQNERKILPEKEQPLNNKTIESKNIETSNQMH